MEYLATAVLGKAHGVHGFIKVHTYSAENDHIQIGHTLTLLEEGRQRQLIVVERKLSGSLLLVKFEGINNREGARLLTGKELWVERSEAAPLSDDEFYVSDLIDCQLLYQGESVGSVIGSFDGSQALLLEIRLPSGEIRLVPFMEPYIGTTDIEGKSIELLEMSVLR